MCGSKLYRSLSVVVCVSAWLMSVAPGAEPATPKQGSGAVTKTTITSHKMTVRNKERLAVFEGKVVLTKGSLIVRSDVMVVFYKPRNEDGAESGTDSQRSGDQSEAGNLSISKIEATGEVKIQKEGGRATCRKAVYYQDEQKLVLTGSPVAWQQGNRVMGRRITMFLDEDRTIVEGGTRLMLEEEGSKR